jgi:hypothetical protein
MNNFMVSCIEHAVVYLVGSQLEQRIVSLLKRQNKIDMAILFSKKNNGKHIGTNNEIVCDKINVNITCASTEHNKMMFIIFTPDICHCSNNGIK